MPHDKLNLLGSSCFTSDDFDEILKHGIQRLLITEQFSLQFVNSSLPVEQGFIDVSIIRSREDVENWNNQSLENYRSCTFDDLAPAFDALGFESSKMFELDSFKEIIGPDPKFIRDEHEVCQFFIIGKERVTLIFVNTEWEDLQELYGSYLKTTKH